MKLHLPKMLLTAVLALYAVSPEAYALTVAEERSITYDSFATDGSATTMPEGVTYDASTGVLTGISSSEVWFKLNTNALTAENAGGHVIYVTATNDETGASCSWGINTDAEGTGLAGYWSPNENEETNPSGTWTDVTISADKIDELNGDGSEIILKGSITASNSGTHLYDVNGNDIYNAGSLKTTANGDVDTLTLNSKYVSSILYNVQNPVVKYTIANADGTFTRTYASERVSVDAVSSSEVEATLIRGSAVNITGKTDSVNNIAKGGDIIIGKAGNLFLQTWNGNNSVKDADILIGNDIYIGATTNGFGALRTADYCGDVIINGDITLIEDALYTKESQPDSGERGTDTIINGKLSGDYTLSVKASENNKDFDDILFAGEIDLKGLTIAANGTGSADFTISGKTAIDTLNVNADTVLTKEGEASMTYGNVNLNQTLELAGSGTISVTATVKGNSSGNAELIIGKDITLEAKLMHAAWAMSNLTVNGVLDVEELRISTNTATTNINGSGIIKADTISMGNQGTYNFEDVRIEVGSGGMIANNTNSDTVYLGDVTFAATDSSWLMADVHDFSLADTETGTTFEVAAEKTITINSVISNKVETVTEGEGEDAVQSEVVTAGKLVKTGAGTLLLNGNNTYTGNTTVKAGALEIAAEKTMGATAIAVEKDAKLVLNAGTYSNVISGEGKLEKKGDGTLTLDSTNTYTGGTSIEGGTVCANRSGALGSGAVYVKNGSTLDFTHQGNETGISSVNLSGGSNLIVRSGYWAQTFRSDILIDGDNTITSGYGGSDGKFQGSIKGVGTLTLNQCIWGNNPTADTWAIESTVADNESGKLAIESTANVTMSGANTYSGGTTISDGTLTAGNESALGTGKVTVNGGTLKQSAALSISAMDYTGGTVNNNGQNLTVAGKLTAAADMSIEGAGSTSIGSLDLSAGTTLTTTGSLTIGELVLDLSTYDVSQSYTLVTTTGEGATVGLSTAYSQEYNGYTATVSGSDTGSLTLSFSEIVTPDTNDITTTVSSFGGITDGMLTLNVGADLADATKVLIEGISDDIMKQILGDSNLPDGGMVGITLVGTDDKAFVATADQVLGFQGKDGIYYGEAGTGNVGWVYQAAYIPEPTTATLSLLALAGLAARRRRKA